MLKSMLLPAEPRPENLAMVSALASLKASSPTVRQALKLQLGQGVSVNKGTFQALVAPGMANGRRGTASQLKGPVLAMELVLGISR
jgi:hypothetical protein